MTRRQEVSQQELELLYDLLRDATKRSDLKGIFHVLFRGGKQGMGASEGLVVQHNPEKSSLEIKVRTQGRLKDIPNLLSDERSYIRELNNIKEVRLSDNQDEMFFSRTVSQIVAPIPVGARSNGLLVLESTDGPTFASDRLAFLQTLLEQTAVLIRSHGKMESSKRELAAWWDVNRRMVSPSELDVSEMDTLLGKVLQLALARTKTSNGIIFMADEKTGELVTHSHAVMGNLISQVPEKLRRRQRGKASGIVFQVLDSNKPYLSNNIEKDPNYIPLFQGIRSHLSVPISFQGRCIGVIVVESSSSNAFTLDDQQTLQELSKSVVTLVRRAQLYEATRDGALGGRGIMIRGLSPEWDEVERRVEKAAGTNASVILRGESGTGKELVAHAIHFNSKRWDKRLVVVNSAAIPDQLLESTLFGHVKGAFTGASYDRVGEFEKANKGTIFLDEIGELGLPLQAKLLRVLQDGEIQKVGSNDATTRVDVRVIAATSRNLEEMMKEGSFREDLYYRLHVVPMWLPPLRQYKKSIPGMVKAFVEEIAREHGMSVSGITKEAMDVLMSHDYPGNVRELKNTIEQAVIMADTDTISVEDLPRRLREQISNVAPEQGSSLDFKAMKKKVLEDFERQYLERLLTQVSGNISKASELSGINRVNFYKLLKRHDIDTASYR